MAYYTETDITYGKHTYGRIFAHRGRIRVGNFCSIGNNVRAIILEDHKVDWITTYPFHRRWINVYTECPVVERSEEIIIENDVWIGESVTLLHDTCIRNGAVVGSNSVVCGEVPPYAVVVGNPAMVIKYRFPEDVVEKLLEIQWWNWDDDKIERYATLLCSNNVDEFMRNING